MIVLPVTIPPIFADCGHYVGASTATADIPCNVGCFDALEFHGEIDLSVKNLLIVATALYFLRQESGSDLACRTHIGNI